MKTTQKKHSGAMQAVQGMTGLLQK